MKRFSRKASDRKTTETDAFNKHDSEYMFNPAPLIQTQLNDVEKKEKSLKRKQVKEKKQLTKKARLLEYMSDEEDYMPYKMNKQEPDDQEDQVLLLDHLQSDIIAYFQAKSQTIINNATRVLEITYNHNSLHLAAVTEIGPNGNYLIVNFTRNKKGFVDIQQLRASDHVSAADYQLGEYLITKVLPPSDVNPNKLQLTLLPEFINSQKFSQYIPGMCVPAIPIAQNDYGYDLSLGKFKGFIKTSQQLKLNRVYTLQIETASFRDKYIVCNFPTGQSFQLDTAIKKNNFAWNFIPGSLYDCISLKELNGGYLVKIEKLGVLGYIFQDYLQKDIKKKQRIQCRLIAYDELTRNLQFSLKEEHIEFKTFTTELKTGVIFDAFKIIKNMFSGCYWVEIMKKSKKDYNTIGHSFLHRSNIIGNVEEFEVDKLMEKKVKLKEFNYFDHCGLVTMRDLLETKGINDIVVGQLVDGLVKQVLIDDEGRQKVVVKFQGLQGLIPSFHLGKAALQVGTKVKTRVIYVDTTRKSILLTVNPILMQCKQFISNLESVSYEEAYHGMVLRQSQNGYVIQFFQGITGFLASKDLAGQEINDIGEVIKVYVKYVNAKESKLLLSLKKVDAEIDNDNNINFKLQQDGQAKAISEMQLPTYEKIEAGSVQQFKVRKQLQLSNNLIVFENKKYVGVLVKEQMVDVPDEFLMNNLLNYYKAITYPLKLLILPSRDGHCHLSLKQAFLNQPFQNTLQVNSFHFGYVEKVTARYTLVTLPRLVGCPTGLIYQPDLKLAYNQTVFVRVKKYKDEKIWLEIAQENQEKQALAYFEQRSLIAKVDNIGDFVKLKVTFVKDYGVVGVFNGITGFVMNSNLLQTPKINQTLQCQVLDFDPIKSIADLREVKNAKLSSKLPISGTVILQKDFYAILKGAGNTIFYLYGQKPLNEKVSFKIVNATHVPPIVIQSTQPSSLKGDYITGNVTGLKGNYLFVSFPNKYYGRIHKSRVTFLESEESYLNWKTEDIEIGQRLECRIISVDHEEKRYELSCLAEDNQENAIVRSVSDGVIQVETGHDKVKYINGWDIVTPENADHLNNLSDYIQPGDACKIKQFNDIIRIVEPADNPLYGIATFQVKSHHNSYIRVQLANHKFASIDITEQNDQWLPGLLSLQMWGKCRVLYEDEKGCLWASVRQVFLNEDKWSKALSPLTGSQLAFKKIQHDLCDFRMKAYKLQQPQIGEVMLGYITGINDFGTFIKFGMRKENILLVNINEYSDDNSNNNLILNRPILVKVIEVEPKLKGTLRKSIITEDLYDEPLTNELVEGCITFIKGDKAYVRIKGFLKQGELTMDNCEGKKDEEGWWFNKVVKVGQVLKLVVIGTRVNKGGKKIVKLTNLSEIVKNAKAREEKGGNEQLVELWDSLEQLATEFKLSKSGIEQEQVEDIEINEENKQVESGEIQEEEENGNNEISSQELQEDEEKQENLIEEELNDEVLKSRSAYEKQIISNPDSSELWIQFISFVMGSEGIERARGIAERSLRVINFQNEVERLNLWTAYLNLEFHFGSEENLVKLFKKGCNSCNPKKLHIKLIDIYRRNKKLDLMVDLCRSLVQKHKQSGKCWMELLNCLMEYHAANGNKQENNPVYNIKKTLERSLQSLKKTKHIRILSHYARLQFQFQQIEQGKTTFDALLSNYPQRTDIWQQYLDLAVKYCSKEMVRELFNRALTMNKKPKRVKFLFKKFLEYESKNGSQQQIKAVKERAEQWVTRFMEQQHIEEEQDDESDQE